MLRLIAAAGLLLIGLDLLQTSAPAIADTLAYPRFYCREAQMDDPLKLANTKQRKQIVRVFEVIIDGVIESYQPQVQVGGRNLPGLMIVRVEKVWKGDVTSRVAFVTSIGFAWTEWQTRSTPIDCPNPIRAGAQVRIGTTQSGKMSQFHSIFPEIDENMDALGGDTFWGDKYLPPHDPELERLLTAYQSKTDALRKAAATESQEAKIAYATHLLDNNEKDRAYEVAGALRRDGVMLSLADPLLLDPEQKDWSDLKRLRRGCYSDHGNFDAALFDRADLAQCAFRYSSFRGASFRGTDLTDSYFQDSDLIGAKYDCGTKLPDDLDPAAAGMINVEGKCLVQQ